MRGMKKARKQAQRGAKLARYVAGRVRSAEKSLYFHLRDTRAGQVLLRARLVCRRRPRAARASARGRDVRPQDGRAAYRPVEGLGRRLVRPASPEFSGVLATSRRLFEVKQAKIAEQMAGFDGWSAGEAGQVPVSANSRSTGTCSRTRICAAIRTSSSSR